MTTPIKVEQVDRVAAAAFYGPHLARPGEVLVTAHMLAGKVDESPLIQAFARHRIAAEAKTHEEDARIASDHQSDDCQVGDCNGFAREIAAAIRSRIPETDNAN